MHKRILLTLAMAIVATLAVSAVADAAAGTVTVYDSGDHKVIQYTGGADANGDVRRKRRRSHGHRDRGRHHGSGPDADPGNICCLSAANTLTCMDPKLGVNDWYAGSGYTGNGGDTVTVTGTQEWIVNGAEGEDKITGSDQADDLLSGGPGNDVIDGLGNSGLPYHEDRIDGGADNDVLRGGAGADTVDGGPGNDEVFGGDGDDYLGGSDGVDALHGDAGDDWLEAGAGDGELSDGGDGSDELLCVGDAGETYDGGAGLDLVDCVGGIEEGPDAGYDDYVIDLAAGTVNRTNHVPTTAAVRSVEDAETRDGNDVLIGTEGANSLFAGAGNDTVDGRGGPTTSGPRWKQHGRDGRRSGRPRRCGWRRRQLPRRPARRAVRLRGRDAGAHPQRHERRPHGASLKVSRVHGNRAKGLIDLRVTSDEAARLSAEAIGRLKRAGRGAMASRVGDVTLGSAARRAAAGKRVRVV